MGAHLNWSRAARRDSRLAAIRGRHDRTQKDAIARRNSRFPTGAQLHLIEQLCAQLGRDVPVVRGRAAASALIDQLKQNLAVRGQTTPAQSTIAPTRSSGAHEEAVAPL